MAKAKPARVDPLPCPCCGSEKLRIGRGNGWVGWGVHCVCCGLSMMRRRQVATPNDPRAIKDHATLMAEAVEAWNKRQGISDAETKRTRLARGRGKDRGR